ncbi:hypothetical protein AURDEDRAFT_110239 [Auricularia subglabra TFB-10046 SS5]|nr:hypothetical protein AURDEDRAFT_110239 [Auricularia subglabra TFB-10046 SS5]
MTHESNGQTVTYFPGRQEPTRTPTSGNLKEFDPFFPAVLSGRQTTADVTSRPAAGSNIPLGLRRWFAIAFVSFIVAVAIALEVALSFSKRNKGWGTSQSRSSQDGILHFVYTLPPIAIAMIIVTGWKSTDQGIKKMQPYIDLAHGNAAAEKSLLLDYTSSPDIIVWMSAFANRHYLVAVSALVLLFSLAAQPLSGALFVVRDIWFTFPGVPVDSVRVVGLNPDASNLAPFVTAAGFAESKALYNVSMPAFVKSNWLVADFNVLPIRQQFKNGTVIVNTTAIDTSANCVKADSVRVSAADTGSFTLVNLAVSGSGCASTFSVDTSSSTQFGVTSLNCGPLPATQKPVAFWVMDVTTATSSSPTVAVAICTPRMRILRATASVDIYTGLLPGVAERTDDPYTIHNNVTDAPLNGNPLNGIFFELPADADEVQRGRISAITQGLPSAILQMSAQPGGGGTAGLIEKSGEKFAQLADQVYTLYLTLVAKEMYFITSGSSTLSSEVRTWQKRLCMSEPATHILAVGLFVLAITASLVHIAHARLRAPVTLAHDPGTLATALALASGHEHMPDARSVLKKRRFRIDPQTGLLVEEGQQGFEDAISPDPRQSRFIVG